MQWPANRSIYPERGFHAELTGAVADLADAIDAARRLLSARVEIWDVPTDDLWCRVSGPIFARSAAGDLAVVDVRLDGCGGKQAHAADARVARAVAERLGVPMLKTGLFGEGGAVEQDGHGLSMAHRSSRVEEGRNPGLSEEEIGRRLLAAYGADRMLWSDGVRGRDITDCHIDGLARFTGPGEILLDLPARHDPDDPFHRAARRTRDRLIAAGLDVTTIREPSRPRVRDPEFVAAYVNYYVCNGAVVAAEFGDPEADAAAIRASGAAHPGREVVALPGDALGLVGGGIHCATQQMPDARGP